jgi:hypothetical protein
MELVLGEQAAREQRLDQGVVPRRQRRHEGEGLPFVRVEERSAAGAPVRPILCSGAAGDEEDEPCAEPPETRRMRTPSSFHPKVLVLSSMPSEGFLVSIDVFCDVIKCDCRQA